MKTFKRALDGLWRAGLAAATGGAVLASSCTADQLKAVLAGVEIVADQLSAEDDDISFGDWLSNELDD